jgi:hypothetical protein
LALSIDDFKKRFPQFAKSDQTLIDSALAEAERFVVRTAWGARANLADDAVANYAAHLVAINPLGESARHKKRDDGRTPYLDAYDRLRKLVVRTPWVV